MPRWKDITGQRFGRLVAIERIGKNDYGRCLAIWLYEDCAIALERKKYKAKEFMQWEGNRIVKSRLTPKMISLFNL